MKRLLIYADTSVIGGCEDSEFSADSLALWSRFEKGDFTLAISELTLRELAAAPEAVRAALSRVPPAHQILLADTAEAADLADAYLRRGVVSAPWRNDALHVALATIGGVDALVSWNFHHLVNLGRIRSFNAVNLESGYGTIEIRTPKEVLDV